MNAPTALQRVRKMPAENVGRPAGHLLTWRRAFLEWSGLPPTTRLVVLVIADYMNTDGTKAFPSLATIANNANLTRRAVATHVRTAIEAGWLTRYHSRNRLGSTWNHNNYVAAYPLHFDECLTARPKRRSGGDCRYIT